MMPPLPALGRQRDVVLQGRPDLGGRRRDVFERVRHHTDDRVAVAVERDLTSNERAVATEAPPPQPVAENDDTGAIDPIIGMLEIASERGPHAQCLKVARAHTLSLEPIGLGRSGEGGVAWL